MLVKSRNFYQYRQLSKISPKLIQEISDTRIYFVYGPTRQPMK